MASAELFSVEQTRKEILEDGFSYRSDSVIGERVDAIAKRGFPFKTEEGLDFCKLSTIDDEVSECHAAD
jgi:hypothetical protein